MTAATHSTVQICSVAAQGSRQDQASNEMARDGTYSILSEHNRKSFTTAPFKSKGLKFANPFRRELARPLSLPLTVNPPTKTWVRGPLLRNVAMPEILLKQHQLLVAFLP